MEVITLLGMKVSVITLLKGVKVKVITYFVGGVEKSLIEQVREMVDPGFTNTELLPWITAAAAGEEIKN